LWSLGLWEEFEKGLVFRDSKFRHAHPESGAEKFETPLPKECRQVWHIGRKKNTRTANASYCRPSCSTLSGLGKRRVPLIPGLRSRE
jgi:hypothetical protein